MHRTLRCTLSLVAIAAAPLAAQRTDTVRLQRILAAEDARGQGRDGVQPLLDGLRDRDAQLRMFAVRGLGRLQQPQYLPQITLLLNDSTAAVRAEAANAVAQAVVHGAAGRSDSTSIQLVRTAYRPLLDLLDREHDPLVRATVIDALGRLPLGNESRGTVESAIRAAIAAGIPFPAVRGLASIARSTADAAPGSSSAGEMATIATQSTDSLSRRVAMGWLEPAKGGNVDPAATIAGLHDADDQVRRLALHGIWRFTPDDRRAAVVNAVNDPSAIVRVAAVSAARIGSDTPDCTPIIVLAHDSSSYVALVAIDSLAKPCADQSATNFALQSIIAIPITTGPVDHRWQRAAHALVALARRDSADALPIIGRYALSAAWGERLAAANAATSADDVATLRVLAVDPDHNVAEAAIAGLSRRVKHAADSLYIRGLASSGNQTVLAAARALAGSPSPMALPALYQSLARLTATRRENTRDPRVALLQRIAELGSAADSASVRPYLADFDSTVAILAAKTLTKWTGHSWSAATKPLPLRIEPLARIALGPAIMLRVTMAQSSGGGSFDVRLFGAGAPATAASILRLARGHYYDGHIFQRVEPDFVVQGGGGDASEYVGDSTFMRDELGMRSHLRGTIGISSRGADTGDGQWFINLIDNTRLDHLYTVAGEITHGLDVAENILEGDRIAQVVVLRAP